MRASREEFKDEMITAIDCAAKEMFNEYDKMEGEESLKFVEKRGIFKGIISGMLVFGARYTCQDMSADHDRVMNALDEELQSIDNDEEREAMLDGCYEIVEQLAVIIYDKKMKEVGHDSD